MDGTNGIEKIKNKILADAEELSKSILEDARREAQSIINNAEKEAFQKVTVMLEKAKEEAVQIKKRIQAISGLEERKKLLNARQDCIDEAFNMSLERIAGLPDDEYRMFIRHILLDAAQEGEGALVINQRDKERLDKSFIAQINQDLSKSGKKSSITIAGESLSSIGGFILKYGEMEINCTLEVLLNMARPALESDVAQILFSE